MRTVVDLAPLPTGIRVQIPPLFAWPEDPLAWTRRVLGQADPRVELVAADDETTDLGWPVTLFQLEVSGEPRLVALYKFLEWAGVVELCGALDEAAQPRVRAALRQARPDFRSDRAICMADLLPRGQRP